ncbi:hypothetical protein WCD74_09770 [Actinomycetospora sp. OC33-EN08]|uniref:Integral membrane protein n=1 Tax=Actinomycetospora aurantiaca TaxID=3129233 RepID=A0ABU8ML65_9PSEU
MSTTGPTDAERRYRRLLTLLPSWYRERYADEMVEVYLAARPDGAPRPSAGEIAATLRLAVTTRTRRVGLPSSATLVLLAVVGSAALATTAVARTAFGVSSAMSGDDSWTMGADGRLVAIGPSIGLGEVVDAGGLMWTVVLGAVLVGLPRIATVIAVLVSVLDVGRAFSPFLAPDASIVEPALARTDARSALLPVVVVLALVLASPARGDRPRALMRSSAALATVAAIAVGGAGVRVGTWSGDGTLWPVASAAVAAAAVVVLLVSRRLDPAWPATVLVLAGLVVLAGPLPAGSRFIGIGVERTVTDGPFDPVLVPGLVVGLVAVVLAAVAWLAAVDRRPDHPARSGSRPDLVGG